MQNGEAGNPNAQGLLGRIVDSISGTTYSSMTNPYTANLFSLAGTVKATDGKTPTNVVSHTDGAAVMNAYDDIGEYVMNISAQESTSVMSETFASLLEQSIVSGQTLADVMDAAELAVDFSLDDATNKAFYQAARLITSNRARQAERDAFFIQLGGFDTHSSLQDTVETKMDQVNTALSEFVEEMKAQVSGWGVYCYDFLLLPITPSVSCSCLDALNTPSSKLPLSPTVSHCLPMSATRLSLLLNPH